MSDNLDTKLAVHEAICASRYASIQEALDRGKERMRNIEWLLYIVIAAVLFGPGVAAEFVKKLFVL
jgi:hypothetical protein